MKYIYVSLQRSASLCLILLWLVALASNSVYAQRKMGYESGVVRIKVKESLALQLENARMTKSANNILITGIQSIDRLSIQYKATGIKRVFRPSGKFEAKHRKYGLHLWFEVQLDKATPILSAIDAYKSIDQIEIAQPLYTKAIIGSDRLDYGPRKVDVNPAPILTGPPNDPLFAQQWHYNNTGQAGGTPGSDISLLQAWGITTGSTNVIVAVTDGGAQVDHPDLAASMWVNEDEIPGNGLDDDNNGYVDDINGYGFGDNTGEIAPDDHGSHTSGTIGATTNNGIGVAGVAGGSGSGDGVRLMSCAAFGAVGVGGFEDTYVYGADNGAVISQNSWGYTVAGEFDQPVLDAIDYFIAEAGKDEFGNQIGPMKGGIVIFAAGNDNSDGPHYPGFYEPTLAVGGVNNQDKKAWYSNFGTWVDIAAPGGETFVNNDPHGVLSTISGGQYAFFQGTSMATPHVSGVAALIVSKFGGPGFTPEMLRGRLTQLTDNIDAADPAFAGLLGSGRLNAFSALQENDGDAPDAIDDLAAASVGITDVTLTWTSPLDSGNGSASVYDVRYSTSPITEENFGAATSYLNPPAPKAAGGTETLTISGLLPGTVYYFAIKSADFFGNFSSVSNILQQATNFAPVIALSSSSLTQNLQTAETSSQILTISNTGLGVLNFTFNGLPGFATPSPWSGTVAPGSSLDVTITFDANNLLAGVYTQDLGISHNDPLQDSLLVHLTLNVTNNGSPIASVEPTSLNFGNVFETDSTSRYVNVHNAGSEPLLITSITSDNSDFDPNFTGTVTVPSFANTVVKVTYTASSLGVSSGNVTIATNDIAHPSFNVSVTGTGVVAPNIIVSPDSLIASLNTGKTSTQSLTIENTGGSDLEFAIAVTTVAPASVVSVKTVSVPSGSGAAAVSGQKQIATAPGKYSNQIKLKSIGKSSVTSKVLIVTPDSDVTDLALILNSFDDIEASILSADSLPLLELSKLLQYDVVLTTNNTQWLAGGGIDPAAIGDLLADYIDAGGKVIVNQFAYSYDAWQMAGRFIDDGYGPFTPSTTDGVVDVELGTILSPGHPLFAGVSSLAYSGYVQNVGLASGATAIAEWDNGELLLAANGNVVALNMLPSLGTGDPLQWSGDLPTIFQNAVHYLSGGGSFVSVSPDEGVVAPGESVNLEVTFDASGLEAGVHTASVDIINNVPHRQLISIPAVLTVLGPEFTISPDSVYDELEKQQTSTHTLILSNNGPDDHSFTVAVQGSGFSTSSVKITKPASSARKASANPAKQKQQKSARKMYNRTNIHAVTNTAASGRVSARVAAVAPSSVGLYSTDFENLSIGDISGQDGWFGQWTNWTVEAENPFGGAQHFRGLADGLGQSAAISPGVPIGTDALSTVSMKVNLQGSDVTWGIIPQSPTAGFIVTWIGFEADGSMTAVVSDGAGGGTTETIATTIPSGYFDLTISSSRDSSTFDVFIDEVKVFSGHGFAGNIEEVVILSDMEEAGPTLDIDNFQIIDGPKEEAPTFVTVSPLSGNLPSGATAEITVTLASKDLTFGLYSTNINVDIDGAKLTVPTSLRVVGDEAIDVDPTVLQAVVDYKGDSTQFIHIENTGGRPLSYGIQVIGASTDMTKLPKGPVSKFANKSTDKRIVDKKAKDDSTSKSIVAKSTSVTLLAGSSLLEENFEGGTFPPTGWTTADNTGEGVVWGFAADYGEGNYTGSAGEAATVSSDAFGPAEFDAELISPLVSTAGLKNIAVQYNVNYANFGNLDFLDLDIEVDGGTWVNVLSWNEDHGTLRGTPGEFVSLSLDSYLTGATSFRLRWHYYDPNSGDWNWYAQIDDVVILGDARAWLTVTPSAGVVPVGESVDVAAKFNASDINSGFYVAGILISSNAVEDPLIGVVATLTVREPAVISVTPDSVYIELVDGLTQDETLTVANSGASVLRYSITDAPIPAATGVIQARRESSQKRTTPSAQTVSLLDTKAILSSVSKSAGAEIYSTGFEEFAPGDINGQADWAAQFGNWTVENFNPAEGSQHFSGLADGFGQSLAFSPRVSPGSDDISTTGMKIDLDLGVTWQIIPQSPTAGVVNTRFQISPDGSLSALVQDSVGTIFYQDIPGTLPEGYFDFRIEIKESTLEFTVYVNDAPIFTGAGFAGDIEQVVIYSLMEDAGQYLDIDNFTILDGPASAPWLTVKPKSGEVTPGGSAVVNLTFDATDVEPGTYTKTLNISSNDPATPNVSVPVTLVIIPNLPPVLSPVTDRSVRELSMLNLTYTATDPDDSVVVISISGAPAFVTETVSTDGFARYAVKPKIGDAGIYPIAVTAKDPRGGIITKTFNLEVIPYGVQNFSLIYLETGELIKDFEDSITIDVADPEIDKYTIRANTRPSKVGSVKFTIDGVTKNVDNLNPYTFYFTVLPKLSAGLHTLTAQAFTKGTGKGEGGQIKSSTIRMINSAAITDFDVVNSNGVKLLDLEDGGIIDVAQAGFGKINIEANTSINSVGSVKFILNSVTARTDNTAPFALKGNSDGSNTFWPARPGYYTLTAIPYMKTSLRGPEGIPLTIHFQVVKGAGPTVANARGGDSSVEEEGEIFNEETGDPVWSVYPVPVKDELHIKLQGKVEGSLSLNIVNLQGQSVHAKEGTADTFRDYSVSTVKLGLNPGVYLVQIQQANGKRVIQKFMKE